MRINAITGSITNQKINYKYQNPISFTSDKNSSFFEKAVALKPKFILPKHQKRYMDIQRDITPRTKEQIKMAEDFARKYPIYKNEKSKSGIITAQHFYLAFLTQLYEFSKGVQDGSVSYETEVRYVSPSTMSLGISPDMWKKPHVEKPQKVLKEEIDSVTKQLEEKSKKGGFVSSLEADEDFVQDIITVLNEDVDSEQVKSGKSNLTDATVFRAMVLSSNRENVKQVVSFYHRLAMAMTQISGKNEQVNLPFYDDVARKVYKNLDRNYNVVVTHETTDKESPSHLINSLVSVFEQEDFSGFKNIRPENTKLKIFNDKIDFVNMKEEINELEKDKDTNYIIVVSDLHEMFKRSVLKYSEAGHPMYDIELMNNVFASKAQNVKMVLLVGKDNYYKLTSAALVAEVLQDFQNIQIPLMDSKTTKQQLFHSKTYVEEQIGMKIDDEAINSAVELFASDKDSKYDKTIRYLKKVASYFIEEEKLTKAHIEAYWESLQKQDTNVSNGPYDIIFDTKMTLDDIIGSPMTKKQAELVVYEIKNNPQTKGYILYNAQGYGGGRTNCAKVIAGEAKIPMVCINAADFAIRDLDTVGTNPMEAIDVKIKKLVDTIKTQAKANSNKTAMLYIQNFDNFASNPLYGISSIYEQQAFSKLVKEMKKSREDNSYNIIVMGSSDMPETINENVLRPGLFMDDLIIYPPAGVNNVMEIAKKHIAKKGYKLSGQTEDENNKILKHFANVIMGSGYVDIVDLLDRANLLAKKANKNAISIAEINEAYLIKTAGMPAEYEMSEREKGLTIRHEGGHALNLQFMYNLFKEEGDSIRIPDSIANIALDPRGDYLGCVYHNTSEENTTTMNLETVFSNIVCSFGGNSAEELFYGMEGSYGISQDLENANYMAKIAVLRMGLGTRMDYFIPDFDENGNPILTAADEENYENDVKSFIYNAKYLSDEIVDCYSEFLNEFAKKYINDFGTGNCIITGSDFAKMLADWEERQSQETKDNIAKLKQTAKAIIAAQKEGEKYNCEQDNETKV
ncbi:MAG: AAA family ATPase [Candidatus Gastranaerophilales bacterium]|nr:AAA family ATPase [Candidatus Gastranaerophilales bacterium]